MRRPGLARASMDRRVWVASGGAASGGFRSAPCATVGKPTWMY